MNWYKFRYAEYAMQTRHLTELEDLVYRRCIDLYYNHKMPFPDADWVAKRIQISDVQVVDSVLKEFFRKGAEGYSYQQADDDLSDFEVKSQKARDAVNARWAIRPYNERNTIDKRREEEKRKEEIREESREEIKKKPPAAVASRFSEFWKAWPPGQRKYGKEMAMNSWSKQALDPEADKIIAHVKQSSTSEAWISGYTPAPTTYLNQRRWDETVQAPARVAK
jgi:uncharacterized protein YdaU (DUF1376 family)